MNKALVYTITIVGHIVVFFVVLVLFSDEGEEKAISKIAQPEEIRVEENRKNTHPTAIVQNPTRSHTRIVPRKDEFVNHIVERGDYLSTIARKYKTSVNKIKVENSLKSDRIYVGQKLTIPQD